MESALAESEGRLRLAIDAGRMAVWELDVARKRLIGSVELNRLLGFPDDAEPSVEEIRSRYFPGERERVQRAGQEAFEHLRRLDPDVHVLLSTGYSPDDEARVLLQSGVRGFLQKPYKVNDLLDAVRTAIDSA